MTTTSTSSRRSSAFSLAARGAVAVVALVGGLLVAPGQADAPTSTTTERSSVGSSSGQRYGWGAALFDFAWEYGESLTSPPARGTRKKGRWIDSSTGTGRAAHYNGGLSLDSAQDSRGGLGSGFGTTSLQLAGNPQTYGRWEFKRRVKSIQGRGKDYRVLVELVPEKGSACTGKGITVAEVQAHRNAVTVGVRPAKGTGWTYTKKARFGENPHAFAVEVAKDHITWLVDGRVIATLKDRSAIPRVPLTPRLSLVGQGSSAMNATEVIYDWMRAWPIARGQHPKNGHALKRGTVASSC